MWVRGLKPLSSVTFSWPSMSHPVWVRGLKPTELVDTVTAGVVAPRVGAWIETADRLYPAWSVPSHPVWVRGLKL